ncbi:D-alanyl-D-alanine carboxypeptidase [Candidatus Tisiphia endosymbiont of Nemotelus uliginosus]|uniref:D-alanyl-D-alanine carboxypeptidase n=1 Tax=Candidatus Tisiphia endosymbiont of Nemotelus uliginosus TaxID=3077926 RepID=UPI0035C8A8BC
MNNNIKIKGEILYSNKPGIAQLIARNEKNFYQVASEALKTSNDYITDYLFAEFADIYGINDWPRAGMLLKQYVLQNFAINLNETRVVDGSGLSRYNMFTPMQFDEFLTKIYQDPNFEIIKLMLARPGEVGTLSNRFQGVNIFAKTGTMSGISSLIGYVFDKNNAPYSVVIVSNNYLGPKLKYAQLEEKIIRILLN